MDPDETPFILPQNVPPPLKNAEQSLYRVIGNASGMRRNMQKILHLIARCINIIEDLKSSISSPPPTFDELITNIELVRKLEILLINFEVAVTREGLLPASLDHEMMETWESSRKEFYALLEEAYDPEFKPSNGWEKDVEQVSRLDDYLWVNLIAQDMRAKGIGGAQKAEGIAANLLEGDWDPSNLNKDIETVMSEWKIIASLSSLSISKDRGSQDRSSAMSSGSPTIMQPHIPNRRSSYQVIQVSSPDLRRGSRGSDLGDSSRTPQPSKQFRGGLQKLAEWRIEPSSSTFQPSATIRGMLEKLAKWRIDPSSIEFPKEAREVLGGHATVSQAFLASPSGGKDRTNQSNPTKNKGPDSGDNAGETSRRWKTVAVKKMKMSGDIARISGLMVRDAEFLVELSHGHIINLEGFVEDLPKDIIWRVFPWKENGTLREFIASAEWEIPERICLIFDVSSGVEYLHNRQPPICHGDLKSLNVLVNSKCRAVITDFGSARRIATDDLNKETKPAQNIPPAALSLEAKFSASTNTITLTGDQFTLRWTAPELLYEEKPGLFSDIWALGWVTYEVMTGFIPFQDGENTIAITRIVQGDLHSVPGNVRTSLIQALCSLMTMCWSIDPRKRPTAQECQESVCWMPRVIPNPVRTSDTAASMSRSPELLTQLGYMRLQQGDYPNALDFFPKAVVGYTDNGDRRGRADALLGLAEVHRRRNEYSQAIAFYSEVLQIRTDIGDRRGRADALLGLAEVHRLRNEYSQAIAFYSEVLQIRTDIGDRRGRADALLGLAEVHRLRNEYSQAIAFYSEVLQIRTDIGDWRGRADALWGLAEVYRLRNEYSQAIAFYSEDLQIRADTGDQLGKARALRSLAEVHRLRNEFSPAITLFSEALHISTDIGDRYGRAGTLLLLAGVHRDHENYSYAIQLYTEAAEVFEEIGNTEEATYASNQAAQIRRSSNREEAI